MIITGSGADRVAYQATFRILHSVLFKILSQYWMWPERHDIIVFIEAMAALPPHYEHIGGNAMKHIRRALAALMVLTMLLSSLPLSTFAEPIVPAETEHAPSVDAATIAEDLETFQQTGGDAPLLGGGLAIENLPVGSDPADLPEITAEPDSEIASEPEDAVHAPEATVTPEVSGEPVVEDLSEVSEAPFESVVPAGTELPVDEDPAEVTTEPTAGPSEFLTAAPTKKPAQDKHARDVAASEKKVSYASGKVEIRTAQELADYFDISLSALADRLDVSEDALLAMSADELENHRDSLNVSAGANAKLSLGKKISGTAYSTYAQEYEIYISRSGRYRLTMYGSKYMACEVYNGSTFISNINHACNGSTVNWTVDLEKGKTYTFCFYVDGRYSSGYSNFNATLDLYIDGSFKDRAGALAFDVYSSYNVKYSNDYQIFCFTALTGKQYRISSTGSMIREIAIYNSDFKPTGISVKGISGSKYFDVSLVAGSTYYILVHGRDYIDSDQWWYKTGSGTLMVHCLDADTSPVSFTMNKTSVDPGLSSSIKFTATSQYAKKVRLLVDDEVVGGEYKISGGKAEFSQSFHVSGSHTVQVQGYTNGGWSLLSRSQTVQVNWASSLGKPVFDSISNNSDTTFAGSDYTLRWRSLSGASKYLVKVYSGSEAIHTATNVSGTSVTIPGDVFGTAGVYTVELYGLADRGQQSSTCATATITVEPAEQLVKPTKVELSESGTVTLSIDDTLQLSASLQPANAIRKLTWSSSNKKVATVENGVVTPLKEGTVTITVKTSNGKKDTVKVKVVDPNKPTGVELTVSGTVSITINDTLQLYANMKPATATRSLTWSSSSKKIATVDENGLVMPLKEGTATITVKTHNGKKDTVKVKIVDPNKPTGVELTVSGTVDLRSDRTLQLYANMKPATATRSLTWTSSNKKVATVDENGLVTPLKAGTTTITVKTHNGKKDTVKIKVQAYYRVQGLQLLHNGSDYTEMYVGDTMTPTVKYTPSQSKTFANLTWKSDKPSVVSVDSSGKLTALNTGYAMITVQDQESGVSASLGIVVTRQPRYRAIVVVENTFVKQNGRTMSYTRSSDRNGIKKMLSQQNFNGRKVEQIADLSNMSKASLTSRIRSLPNQWDIHEDDVTYFFFGGHGSNNGYLQLYNGGAENEYISAYELKSLLDAIPGKVVVVIGSCYSGYFIHDGIGAYSDDAPDPKDFTDAIINAFAEGDTVPVVAIDESGEEIALTDEEQSAWEANGIGANRGELRQSKYYVLTAASHAEQGWFYYWYKNNKIIESKSFGCFERGVCYAGGRDSVGGKSTWKSGTKTLQQVYTTVQKKVNEYHKKYSSHSQSVQVYPKNSNFVIFSK